MFEACAGRFVEGFGGAGNVEQTPTDADSDQHEGTRARFGGERGEGIRITVTPGLERREFEAGRCLEALEWQRRDLAEKCRKLGIGAFKAVRNRQARDECVVRALFAVASIREFQQNLAGQTVGPFRVIDSRRHECCVECFSLF